MEEYCDDKCLFNRFQCSCIFYLGEGRGVFWEGAVLRGRHKGFFEEVGGGNNVVCLKTRTLYLGEEMFMGGGGSFMGEI